MRTKKIALKCVRILLLAAAAVYGQVPHVINYQGILNDPTTGAPIDTVQAMTFAIYSPSNPNVAIWQETQNNVFVENGYFSVMLGSVTPIPPDVFEGAEKYLGVKVGDDPEMTPRQRIFSVGYAFKAENADKVAGQTLGSNDGSVNESGDPVSWYKIKDMPADFADGADAVGLGGISQVNVGTGMSVTNPTGPTASLGLKMGHGNSIDADMVDGNHASAFATASHNHVGESWSASIPWSNGVLKVTNTNSGPGLWGVNSGGGNAVRGDGYGSSIGVYGEGASGPGVAGRSASGDGVQGFNTGNGNEGYLGGTYGAMGKRGNYTGYLGFSDGGVVGLHTSGNYGYLGMATRAGYFNGNVDINGTLSKGAGSFKIDHPLDPANKYLYHSFVESPDMMNVYNGNITLDTNGEATVSMPDWFEVLNKDFRYQLTAIGAPGPNLYIAEEISGNRFRIAGGAPGMKVSWQVTGIRHDAFANAHRIPVEQVKSGPELGRYLYPKELGMPETMGIAPIIRAGTEAK